ncbi:MAG TPA: glycine zipper 2TM domain-containing protein [Nevskiaceae bacterium]|nr:glycine zipper 2TM domain-containing protein [Nevskiaceae bacterium]
MDDRMKWAAALAVAVGLSAVAQAEVYTNEMGQKVECQDVVVNEKKDHPIAAPLAGAVIGGVVGNQVGSGSGKDIATGVGAAGGAMAGKSYNDNRVASGGQVQRVCKPVG